MRLTTTLQDHDFLSYEDDCLGTPVEFQIIDSSDPSVRYADEADCGLWATSELLYGTTERAGFEDVMCEPKAVFSPVQPPQELWLQDTLVSLDHGNQLPVENDALGSPNSGFMHSQDVRIANDRFECRPDHTDLDLVVDDFPRSSLHLDMMVDVDWA